MSVLGLMKNLPFEDGCINDALIIFLRSFNRQKWKKLRTRYSNIILEGGREDYKHEVTRLSHNFETFTEALKTRVRSQTRLVLTQSPESDASMTGAITSYTIAPVSVQATNNNTAPIASATRLSITVSVKYTNAADKKLNFEQSFTRYADYTGELSTQEQALIQRITQQLTEDIFNRAFANW